MKRGIKSSTTAALAILAFVPVSASLQAREITVPSGAILTIQQGVDAAAPGDTVIVLPGTYFYDDVTEYWPPAVGIYPDKPGLKLKAVGPPGSVKIVGPGWGNGTGIWINADNARLEGFEISGFRLGISAGGSQTQGAQIARNMIHDCSESCILVSNASNYEVDHNTLDGAQDEPSATESHGIFLNGGTGADLNTQHHLHHNRVNAAQNVGIFLWQSPGCKLDHNECDHNGVLGIYLASSPNCTADHNQADENGEVGIVVLSSLNCAVTGNEAINNASFGIWVDDSWSRFERNVAEGNGEYDLFAPGWGSDPSDPRPNTYLKNRADTAVPDLAFWDVKPSK